MFTGIVEEIGTIKATLPRQITVVCKKVIEGTRLGDSIAVNGVCLTVTACDSSSFTIGIMPETLRKTNLGLLHSGDPVNLERALEAGGRMGGHFVQGHIDGIGTVVSVTPEEAALLVRVSAPKEIMRYVVQKGFIAIDGISLTVIDQDSSTFGVSLVTHTQENVTLSRMRAGSRVNIEVDILGKYVERFVSGGGSRIDLGFLTEHGFLESKR